MNSHRGLLGHEADQAPPVNGYGEAAPLYLAAGWASPLPLPPRAKKKVPSGYTGWNGVTPTPAQIERWRQTRHDGNIALRLGTSVIGVDLDLYKNPDAREMLEDLLGAPLPPTWHSTSRDDGSGIYLYRVPPLPAGKRWNTAPVPGIEIIQRSHRYAVCWPSIHPEGRLYRWIDHNGAGTHGPPVPDDLAFLHHYEPLLEDIDRATTRDPVDIELTDGEPSRRVRKTLDAALAACNGQTGSRHDRTRDNVAKLIRLADLGEPGVASALDELRTAFVAAVATDRGGQRNAETEFDDLVGGATQLVAGTAPTRLDDPSPRRDSDYHDAAPGDEDEPPLTLTVVTVETFAERSEPGSNALLGSNDDNVIPANGDVMLYGDGGAGKTTLSIDLGCHLCAATEWIGLPIPRQLNGLIIENEGPRPNLRDKLHTKLAAWHAADECPDLEGRLTIVEEPWAQLRLDKPNHRQALADVVRQLEIDFIIIGPLATSGMVGHGTIEETRAFVAMLADVRQRAGRPVAFIVVHHQNRAGQVSGAWEGAGDTLIHVRKRDHGRTGLHIDKARWASGWHGKTLELLWRDGERFEVELKEELSDSSIADAIATYVANNPGTGWTKVEESITGVRAERKRTVRDRLLTDRVIINLVKIDGVQTLLAECPERKTAHLYLADEPSIGHLRPEPDADGTQIASGLG